MPAVKVGKAMAMADSGSRCIGLKGRQCAADAS